MATRHWLGAIATLAIAPALVLPAEATVFRIQARPLHPHRGRTIPDPVLTPDPPGPEVPGWLDWALRLRDGRAFTFAHPTREGSVAGLRWRVDWEAGLKGQADLGYGPALGVNGRLSGRSGDVAGHAMALATSKGVSWLSEVTLGSSPWALSLRAWDFPGSSSLGQSATLVLRRGF